MHRLQTLARSRVGITYHSVYNIPKQLFSDAAIKARMAELNTLLAAANDAYYVHAIPTMSDAEYDSCYKELQNLEKDNPVLKHPNSVTMVVGSSLSSDGQKRVRHKTQMTSINSVFEESDVIRFEETGTEVWNTALDTYIPLTNYLFPGARVTKTKLSTLSLVLTPAELVIITQIVHLFPEVHHVLKKHHNICIQVPSTMLEYKYDGVAMSLTCNVKPSSNQVVSAATRGDGFYGEDISDKLDNIVQIGEHDLVDFNQSALLFSAMADELETRIGHVVTKLNLNIDINAVLRYILVRNGDLMGVELRGEAVLCRDVYNAQQKKGLGGVNARNTVAGILNRKFDEFDYARERAVAESLEYKRPVWFIPYQQTFATDANTIQALAKRIAVCLDGGSMVLPLCLDHISRHRILCSVFSKKMQKLMQLSLADGKTSIWDECTRKAILRDSLPFDTDGIVLKQSDQAVRQLSGVSGKCPRWAQALKFGGAQAWTTIEGIDLTVGRTGRITPVARVKPVAVGGVTVAKASLHNHQWLQERLTGTFEGDLACIERRGDVIPAVVAVKPSSNRASNSRLLLKTLPCRSDGQYTCPCSLGSPQVSVSQLGEGSSRSLFCSSEDCEGKVVGKQQNFASKSAANISGISAQFITPLVQLGLLDSRPSSFLRLRMNSVYRKAFWELIGRRAYTNNEVNIFKVLDESGFQLKHPERYITPSSIATPTHKHNGFGSLRIASMEKAIQFAFEHLTLTTWLTGSGIPGLGKASAQKITAAFPTATDLYYADNEAISALKIPTAIKEAFVLQLQEYLRDEMLVLAAYGVSVFQNLLTRSKDTVAENQPEFSRYQGQNFVFTGSSNYDSAEVIEALKESINVLSTPEKLRMLTYLTTEENATKKKKLHRSLYEGVIALLGGKCTGDVNRQTTTLVQLGEKKLSTKTAKATKLGVAILSEDEF